MKIGFASVFLFLFLIGGFVSAENIFNCTDSDGGKDIYTNGEIKIQSIYSDGSAATAPTFIYDECFEGILKERYCNGGAVEIEEISCPSGYKCMEDKCVKSDSEYVADISGNEENPGIGSSGGSVGCKSLYWIDNQNKNCEQKEFCGAYMYYGLQTFESKSECEKAIGKTFCTAEEKSAEICTMEWMPVCGSDGVTYGNDCGACAAKVDYWTQGECSELVDKNQSKNETCFVSGDGCCKGNICAHTSGCGPNTTSLFLGCDENCNPKITCITRTTNLSNLENETKTFNLSNGRKAEIKIMPETASQTAIARLGELNFTIMLKEVGNNQTAYELTSEKQGKMFGLFKIKGNVSIQVDAETGKVLKEKKPWWAFLATGI